MYFPVPVVKLIASDLNQGDKAKDEVKHLEKVLDLSEKKINRQDSLITDLRKTIDNQYNVISMTNEKYTIVKNNYDFVLNELNRERRSNKLQKFFYVGAIIALTSILIIK